MPRLVMTISSGVTRLMLAVAIVLCLARLYAKKRARLIVRAMMRRLFLKRVPVRVRMIVMWICHM